MSKKEIVESLTEKLATLKMKNKKANADLIAREKELLWALCNKQSHINILLLEIAELKKQLALRVEQTNSLVVTHYQGAFGDLMMSALDTEAATITRDSIDRAKRLSQEPVIPMRAMYEISSDAYAMAMRLMTQYPELDLRGEAHIWSVARAKGFLK